MKQRILDFMKDMESNDAKRVASWFTEKSILWIPPAAPITGLSRIQALFRALFAKYNGVHWKIMDILPISEHRCIHICESWGNMKGVESYKNQVLSDIVFDDEGKILSLSDYFKDTSVFSRS